MFLSSIVKYCLSCLASEDPYSERESYASEQPTPHVLSTSINYLLFPERTKHNPNRQKQVQGHNSLAKPNRTRRPNDVHPHYLPARPKEEFKRNLAIQEDFLDNSLPILEFNPTITSTPYLKRAKRTTKRITTETINVQMELISVQRHYSPIRKERKRHYSCSERTNTRPYNIQPDTHMMPCKNYR